MAFNLDSIVPKSWKPKQEKPASIESNERPGQNVEEILLVLRHGDRHSTGEKKGALTESGRLQAREVGRSVLGLLGEDPSWHDSDIVVQAFGSQQGPKMHLVEAPGKEAADLGRAAETAHIVSHMLAGDRALATEESLPLNFGTILSPEAEPGFQEIYDAALPADYESLSPEEKVKAANAAHLAGIKHLENQEGPAAAAYRKEAAGAVASVVNDFRERAAGRPANARHLDVLGTHGLMVEFLLKEALIQEDGSVGMKSLDEIGGGFLPAEGWTLKIARDERGREKGLEVVFLGKSALPKEAEGKKFLLDSRKVNELAKFYETLHAPKEEEDGGSAESEVQAKAA